MISHSQEMRRNLTQLLRQVSTIFNGVLRLARRLANAETAIAAASSRVRPGVHPYFAACEPLVIIHVQVEQNRKQDAECLAFN